MPVLQSRLWINVAQARSRRSEFIEDKEEQGAHPRVRQPSLLVRSCRREGRPKGLFMALPASHLHLQTRDEETGGRDSMKPSRREGFELVGGAGIDPATLGLEIPFDAMQQTAPECKTMKTRKGGTGLQA